MEKNYNRGYRKRRDFSGQEFYNDKKFRGNKFSPNVKKESINIRELEATLMHENFSWHKNCIV